MKIIIVYSTSSMNLFLLLNIKEDEFEECR